MTATLPYVVIVSDGVSIRTLHPPAFGADLPALTAIVARALGPAEARPVPPPRAVEVFVPRRSTSAMMTQREIASASGYSGNACATCGSFAMKRTGTCETCEACGSTSGGCS